MIIQSSQYKNLYFTYLLSTSSSSKGTVILLDGLPSNPSSKDGLMKKLSEQNYDVFFPRYEGSWESVGEFLKRSPSESIAEFIEALKTGIDIKSRKYIAKKVFILGASFGGGVALDIASRNIVDKTCVTSPVICFKNVNGINTLEDYLKTVHDKSYRFNSLGWQKLLNDKMWDLDNVNIQKPKNVLIIAGKDDDQINEVDLVKFGKKNRVRVSIYEFGHITLSKITEKMFEEILRFFFT